MPVLAVFIPTVTAAAYLLAALRLACYCRGQSRYRRSLSLLASLFGASLSLCGLEILLLRPPVSLWHALTSVLLCLLIFRSKGNVAALMRPGT
ncbi:phage holin family protein [Pseudomonas viridiflava]|uniref:phage holin family protein n=1 Tax=Pseudomonas viridiflava TaxID=33069 RepID=UPI001F617F5B|nr:phage holin family protein [Pseudomonas viridiflava]MCI3908855.1 phage holin family protein [Pseudomonas viridiflava]